MKKSPAFQIILLVAIALLAGISIGKIQTRKSRFSESGSLPGEKLGSIIAMIEKMYVDSVNITDLVEKTIPGLLETLDPHSTYIPAKDMQEVVEEMQGNFSGIGVQFSIQEDTIMIIDVVSGGPSAQLGILAGDRIVKVNGEQVAGTGITNEKVLKLLRGPRGTRVEVSIQRKGYTNLFDFDITRGDIPVYSVDVSYLIDAETGYIKVSRFAENTYAEFTDAMNKLDKAGADKIILDLRGNPGGVLGVVIRMANEFLEKGDTIVVTQGKSQPKRVFTATDRNVWANKKIFVLIDEFSVSASEIFAGAIQDNDRGIIVGRRSFGKGLVQEQIPFPDGSALRLTVSRYYTPSGRCIQKSYEEGNDTYNRDLIERMTRGEFEVADSIHFADSLKYLTKKGRIVYGGGGIMPDYFVPADTSGRSDYFDRIYEKGLVYQFAFHYTDTYRDDLKKLKSAKDIEQWLENKQVLQAFVSYAAEKGVKPDPQGLKVSGFIINTQIKAYIARNMLGEEGFYPIFHHIDNTLLKAVELSRQDLLVEDLTGENPG